MNIDPKIASQRAAHNAFRSTLTGGSLVLSAGIIALGAANQAVIVASVRSCVLPDDDPLDAHEIGDVEVTVAEPGVARWRELIFFRVVRPNNSVQPIGASPDAANGPQLVVMLAAEWFSFSGQGGGHE